MKMILVAAALIAVDGDTVKIPETGERLRLIAIDAPERGHRSSCEIEKRQAERAHERMQDLLPFVVGVEDTGKRGGYGRRLVRLHLTGGETVSDILTQEGLAVWWAGRRHDWCD